MPSSKLPQVSATLHAKEMAAVSKIMDRSNGLMQSIGEVLDAAVELYVEQYGSGAPLDPKNPPIPVLTVEYAKLTPRDAENFGKIRQSSAVFTVKPETLDTIQLLQLACGWLYINRTRLITALLLWYAQRENVLPKHFVNVQFLHVSSQPDGVQP